jgi:hypothetical protein
MRVNRMNQNNLENDYAIIKGIIISLTKPFSAKLCLKVCFSTQDKNCKQLYISFTE